MLHGHLVLGWGHQEQGGTRIADGDRLLGHTSHVTDASGGIDRAGRRHLLPAGEVVGSEGLDDAERVRQAGGRSTDALGVDRDRERIVELGVRRQRDPHVRDLLALNLVAGEREGDVPSGSASARIDGQMHDVAGVLGVGDRHGLVGRRGRAAVDGGDRLSDLEPARGRRPLLDLDHHRTGITFGDRIVQAAQRSNLGRLLGVVHLQGVLHLQLARWRRAGHA